MNFIFPYIGNVIIPTDFHSIIFQRGWWLNHQPDQWLDPFAAGLPCEVLGAVLHSQANSLLIRWQGDRDAVTEDMTSTRYVTVCIYI